MRSVAVLLTFLALLLAYIPAVADDPTPQQELAALAQSIQKVLKLHDESSVRVGPFRFTRDLSVSQGPGLCRQLSQELARLGVKVDPQARIAAEGEYVDKNDKKSKRVYIHLTCHIIERKGKKEDTLQTFQRGIFGVPALIEFLTPSAIVLDPAQTDKQREENLIKQVDDELAAPVDGSRIFADAKKIYGIEVLVKKNGTDKYAPRPPQVKAGQVYVPLERDEVFAIRLVNQSPHDAAAIVMIDGLDVFTFSDFVKPKGTEAPPAAPRWLVFKRNESLIYGWPIRSGLSYEFTVTDYAKSAIAEVGGSKSKVGVVNVKFAAAWPKGTKPPEDELPKGSMSLARGDFIGKGAPKDTPFQTLEMAFGATRAAVSIRYQRE